MRVVVALGGNALLQRGERPDAELQARNVVAAVQSLAPLAAKHEFIVTHGNGPQVGLLALQSAGDASLTRPYPFDVLGAETQGLIGYMLVKELHNALPERQVACVLTQTLVDPTDPAFANPTKFVGAVYDEQRAKHLAAENSWTVKADGAHWRRVVPSPEPKEIVELGVINTLLAAGVTVVCAGGGGIPVDRDSSGKLTGVEAVIDKDLTGSLLARSVKADALLLLTDVENVVDGWGTPEARAIREITPAELRALKFPAGSMGPKVDAVCRFVEQGGTMAAIGSLTDAAELLAGTKGTIVRN